jgi:hypothetical protein
MKKRILWIGFLLVAAACNAPLTATPAAESTPTQPPPPTPQPASPTPAWTDTPAPTSTPEAPPLYFTDEFDTSSPYWQFLQTGGVSEPNVVFENSALTISLATADTWAIGVHTAHTYPNVFVRARVSASTAGSAGLICRYSEEWGWYEFNAASDGGYSLLYGKWLAPGIAQYVPIGSGASTHLTAGVLSYELGLSCADNFVVLYANDNLIRRFDVTNYGLGEGGIGVTASSLKEAPAGILFEWVRVGIE